MAKNKIDILSLEIRITVCQDYAELWEAFFQMFVEIGEESKITEEEEAEFEQISNILALNHYKFVQLCGEYLKEADEVIKIIADCVSLRDIQLLPEATRSKLDIAWHTAFIDMHKGIGKMLAALPPKRLAALQAAQQGGDPQQPAA